MNAPLIWGIDEKLIKQAYPMVITPMGSVSYNGCILKNFPGDCGALILQGANSATKETLKVLVDIASMNGFSKIFATVVAGEGYSDRAAEAFKATRWKCVHKGKSNRNPHKDDYVFVKIIRNCKYKGY